MLDFEPIGSSAENNCQINVTEYIAIILYMRTLFLLPYTVDEGFTCTLYVG